jgi:hypothetical protein
VTSVIVHEKEFWGFDTTGKAGDALIVDVVGTGNIL